jgi:hypothetical protein
MLDMQDTYVALFLKYLDQDLIRTNKLRDVLEFYPPQNQDVSRFISKAIGANQKNILIML